jgi:hypothetical protein
MAYPCKIWLKAECDGCGMCDEDAILDRYSPSRRRRVNPFEYDEDNYNPFEPDWEEDY